jgi:hypothetical protein
MMPHLPKLTQGLAKSVIGSQNAGRMAKSIAFHKAPKASLNPTIPKKPLQFRKYNPIKVAIHQRGSKKTSGGLGKIVMQQNPGSAGTTTPGASGIAFGGE